MHNTLVLAKVPGMIVNQKLLIIRPFRARRRYLVCARPECLQVPEPSSTTNKNPERAFATKHSNQTWQRARLIDRHKTVPSRASSSFLFLNKKHGKNDRGSSSVGNWTAFHDCWKTWDRLEDTCMRRVWPTESKRPQCGETTVPFNKFDGLK